MIDQSKAISFTGHRMEKILSSNSVSDLSLLCEKVYNVVLSLYKEGYTIYLSGMAQGFDMIAAEIVLKVRLQYPDIKLIAVIPYKGQDSGYTPSDKLRYQYILDKADDSEIISDCYYKNVFLRRNDYLIDNCSKLVCYYDGLIGGTMYTVNKATKKNIPIINISDRMNR